MTAAAVILALVLGLAGLVYLLVALLILLTRRSARGPADKARTA
jgi:hypothetical protein